MQSVYGWLRQQSRAVVAVLVAVAGMVTITIVVSGDENGKPKGTVTIHVDGADGDRAKDDTVTVPKAAIQAAAPSLERNLSRLPDGTPSKTVQAIERTTQKIKAKEPGLPTAGASQSVPGCRTEFVRNQSSRYGVRPQQHWLHYTVSYNRAGWSDVNAVVALFDRSSWGASSNFVIDGEGHCAYIVPIEAKAWAQAGANRFAVSYEVIDYGNERQYLAPAGMAKLRSVMRIVSARTSIPMRRGAVRNCTPARSGIVQHKDGGACAGGHHDIYPFPINAVVTQLTTGGKKPPTAHASALCREYAHYRREVRAHTFPESKRARSVKVRDALAKAHYRCTANGGAVRK